jgi:hypothetical protein
MNVSVLKKRCYEKGVSMYNNRTLKPKDDDRLAKECANGSKVKGNENTMAYGVPPRPERARAIRKERPEITVQEAIALAAAPFYSFKNPTYLPGSPVGYNKNSLFYTIGHDVWTIVPEYFPGPSKTNTKRPVKKVPTAAQTLRRKEQDAQRDLAYKKKWGRQKTTLRTQIPKRYKHGSKVQKVHTS